MPSGMIFPMREILSITLFWTSDLSMPPVSVTAWTFTPSVAAKSAIMASISSVFFGVNISTTSGSILPGRISRLDLIDSICLPSAPKAKILSSCGARRALPSLYRNLIASIFVRVPNLCMAVARSWSNFLSASALLTGMPLAPWTQRFWLFTTLPSRRYAYLRTSIATLLPFTSPILVS